MGHPWPTPPAHVAQPQRQVHLTLEAPLYAAVRDLAAAEERSVNAVVRRLLTEALAARGGDNGR